MFLTRKEKNFDVLIVGAGPSGLSSSIKLAQLAKENNIPIKRYIEIKKIIYYNYMDCRVIIDILKLLRTMC